MPVLMPAFSSRVFNHLANVEGLTGLCGFTTVKNSLVWSAPPWVRSDSVRLSYICSVALQHSTLSVNAGKKKSALDFPDLDCFARPASWNTTPSGVKRLNLRSSFTRSADRNGLLSDRSMASLQVRSRRARESHDPCDLM